MKSSNILLCALAAAAMVSAQAAPYKHTLPSGKTITVTPYTDNIFRVTTSDASTPVLPQSKITVLEPGNVDVTLSGTPSMTCLSTPTTIVRIDNATGRVSFYDPDGKLLISELAGVDNSKDVKSISFVPGAAQNFYGAGERGHKLRLNGDTLVNFNRQNYGYTNGDPRISQMGITMPYLVSDLGYSILVDDYNSSKTIVGDTITYLSETPKPLSYYFINGNGSLAGTTEGLTRLTGRQELPPFWALGYITSKYGYRTQDEMIGVIDTLQRRGYPVDGAVLDLYWYGQETDMGRLEWNKDQWPDHKKMLQDLKKRGVNMVIISQPYINKIGAIDNYNMLADEGMLVRDKDGNVHDVTTWVGDAGMFDVSNPKTREWLWNRYKQLTEEGVEGWWGDLGEPEVHPLTIMHDNGESASQYHNIYGNEWSRIIYEGFKKDFPDKRLMTLMRGGTAGLQRYNVFPWTTDVSRSWGGLQPQVKLMLNAGLSGLGYMSSDIGGFAVDPEHPLDSELYVRWLEMGAFTPVFRTHAQLKPEPYHYPEVEKISKKYIDMRYEWLPYNYTLAAQNAAFGLPLARPLNFVDADLKDVPEDEYLWGNDVLVAPIIEKGARSRKVVFPTGTWIDFFAPEKRYTGPVTATVKAPLDKLPLFVREGSFIPQYREHVGNTGDYNPALLNVLYYPSAEETSYSLFEDDRTSTTSLQDGAFVLLNFTGCQKDGEIEIGISAHGNGYDSMPLNRMITFEIPGVAKEPTAVKSDVGFDMMKAPSLKAIRQSGYFYDKKTRMLYVRLPFDTQNPETITITL